MELREIKLSQANAFVIQNHRHHDAVIGHKWSLGAFKEDILIGVAIVGRPTGRYLDDGKTLEVTRLCTDGTRNACSFLYSACARRAKKDGYEKIITFILESETGASLKASGWECEAKRCGKPFWNAERYADKEIQMTLWQKKKPPHEYKQRWVKKLNKPIQKCKEVM